MTSNEKNLEKNVNEKAIPTQSETSTTDIAINEEKTSSTNEVNKVETTSSTTTVVKVEDKDELNLTHLDKDFVYELMSVPTLSSHEYRLVTFIILWARRNNIEYEFDDYGNVYLTKGTVNEGEFYPCVTAHLDSVQSKHKLYAQAGQPLNVKTRISTTTKKHEIYVDDMGIGGDDKAGVLIGLSMFKHVDCLKAAFFLEEEIGCKGSAHLNKEWFKDVGYVLGYDSPDLNRAAWSCSGVKLFSADFFKTHMQKICEKHGLTKFYAEPYTDVKEIRTQTDIICMNFGSGYYNAHSEREYCVIEDMDTACRMGAELIEHLGKKSYKLSNSGSGWTKGADGIYRRPIEDEDEKFLRTLSGYSYGGYNGATANKTTTTYNTSATTATKVEEKKDEFTIETIEYISERYEDKINNIKNRIHSICEANNIDFALFEKEFSDVITF